MEALDLHELHNWDVASRPVSSNQQSSLPKPQHSLEGGKVESPLHPHQGNPSKPYTS